MLIYDWKYELSFLLSIWFVGACFTPIVLEDDPIVVAYVVFWPIVFVKWIWRSFLHALKS